MSEKASQNINAMQLKTALQEYSTKVKTTKKKDTVNVDQNLTFQPFELRKFDSFYDFFQSYNDYKENMFKKISVFLDFINAELSKIQLFKIKVNLVERFNFFDTEQIYFKISIENLQQINNFELENFLLETLQNVLIYKFNFEQNCFFKRIKRSQITMRYHFLKNKNFVFVTNLKNEDKQKQFELFLLKTEPRFYQMVTVLNFWANKFTESKTIFWLIVIYLQNAQPNFLLPSFENIEKSYFAKNVQNLINGQLNTQSIEELIVNFFKFYSEMELSDICSPYTHKQKILQNESAKTITEICYKTLFESKMFTNKSKSEKFKQLNEETFNVLKESTNCIEVIFKQNKETILQKTLKEIKNNVRKNWTNYEIKTNVKINPNDVTFESALGSYQFVQELVSFGTEDNQIKYFLDELLHTQESFKKWKQIVDSFEKILQDSELSILKPKLKMIRPFDSKWGFNFFNIDISISIESDGQLQEDKSSQLLVDITNAILMRHFQIPFNHKAQFSFRQLFINKHQSYDQFDFYEVNFFAANSKEELYCENLLKQVAKYDDRFYPLTMLLLYWAHSSNVIDVQNHSSWYPFTLLVIFFLQNIEPTPILPPISKDFLSSKFEKENSCKPNQNCSVYELAVQFFNFYKKINFFDNILSLQTGILKPITKSERNFKNSVEIIIEDLEISKHYFSFEFFTNNFNWEVLLFDFNYNYNSKLFQQLSFLRKIYGTFETYSRNEYVQVYKKFYSNLKQGRWNSIICKNNDLVYIKMVVAKYFDILTSCLDEEELNYRTLFSEEIDDFCFYANYFAEFIKKSMFFERQTVQKYLKLIERYTNFFPKQIVQTRNILISSSIETKFSRFKVDYEMIGYFPIEPKKVFEFMPKDCNSQNQLDYLIENISMSESTKNKQTQFLAHFNFVLANSPFSELKIKAVPFGSLANGLGFRDSDLDIFLHTELFDESVIFDYETSKFMLYKLRNVLQKGMGFSQSAFNSYWFIPSRRCPIMKLEFASCYLEMVRDINRNLRNNPHMATFKFNHADISVTSPYGMYNSRFLKVLTEYEPRFLQVAMFLKYWAKRANLINNECLSSYALTMMIIYYMQNTNPWILPSVQAIQELVKIQKKNKKETFIDKYNFSFCDDPTLIPRNSNTQTAPELIIGFYRFYQDFDYENQAICPRLGKRVTKEEMYEMKKSDKIDQHFRQSYICIEDPFLLEHNCGAVYQNKNKPLWKSMIDHVLNQLKVDEDNFVQVLCDPTNFGLLSSKEKKNTIEKIKNNKSFPKRNRNRKNK